MFLEERMSSHARFFLNNKYRSISENTIIIEHIIAFDNTLLLILSGPLL